MKEQKILYFDIINGISGDMTLATLLDLGVPKQIFLEDLDKLNLGKEFKIEWDIGYCFMNVAESHGSVSI